VTSIRLKTLTIGYSRAHKRLEERRSIAYAILPSTDLDPQAAEEVWIALFEALNWMYALVTRPEVEARIDSELRDALVFVRGRVQHQWDDAIEFRRDVPLELGPTPGPIIDGPLLSADWCWRYAADLRGGKRASTSKQQKRSGEHAYKKLLAGRQVSVALDLMASLAAEIYNESPS
jgi:hypothetical protein